MSDTTPVVRHEAAARRANAYYALARALQPPREWQEDLPDLLLEGLASAGGDLPGLAARLAREAASLLEDREQVAVAHARLFLGPFEILAAPWASFYLEAEPKLMGEVSQYAAAAYAEVGLGPSDDLKDVPDHVTHELEFMYYLAFQEATTDDPEWRERRERFWREHLGVWLPRFADAVTTADAHPFYGAVAEAVRALCALEDAPDPDGPAWQ